MSPTTWSADLHQVNLTSQKLGFQHMSAHHKYHNCNDIIPCNLQVAEFEAMVESVPTVFIMSFALAVTGGKGVITEEGGQNLFSPEVSFLCLWLIVVTGKLQVLLFLFTFLTSIASATLGMIKPLKSGPCKILPAGRFHHNPSLYFITKVDSLEVTSPSPASCSSSPWAPPWWGKAWPSSGFQPFTPLSTCLTGSFGSSSSPSYPRHTFSMSVIFATPYILSWCFQSLPQ